MAAVPPPGMPVGPPPGGSTTVRTLKDRCADPSYDPYAGDYEDAYRHFGVRAGPDNSAVLTQALLASTSTAPLYFAACVHYGPNAYRVIAVHHTFTMHPLPGRTSEHDGKSYALMGDVIQGQIPTIIDYPLDLLDNPAPDNGQLTVMRKEALIEYFAENPNEQWMPEDIPADDRQVVRVRKGVFVPTVLVPYLIGHPRSPRDAFMHVAGETIIAELVDVAGPLLEWLAACCQKRVPNLPLPAGLQLPPAPVTSTSYFLRTPNTDELVQVVLQKIWLDLPALQPGRDAAASGAQPFGTDATGHAMIHAIEALTASNMRPPAPPTVKSPADAYGTTLETLLRIEHVERQEQLPRVWTDLARCTKGQMIPTLTNHFSMMAARLGVTPPLVTKKVMEFFVGLRFGFIDPSNLLDSISPFLFPPLNTRQRTRVDDVYRAYTDLLNSGGLITMREAGEVDESDRRAVPIRTLTDMRETLTGFHVFVHVMFDVAEDDEVTVVGQPSLRQHSFVTQWDLLYAQIQQNDRRWEEELANRGRAFDVVRWVHLRSAIWAHTQHRSSTVISVPRFITLWECVMHLDTSWVPSKAPEHASYGGLAITQGRSGRSEAEASSQNEAEPATGNRRTRGAPAPTANKKPRVHQDFEFIRADDTKKLKDAVAKGWRVKDPPPFTLHTPGIPYCLAYHTKGSCNSNCSKVADHIEHSDEDHAALKAWVDRNF
jgi:hypothetical protein